MDEHGKLAAELMRRLPQCRDGVDDQAAVIQGWLGDQYRYEVRDGASACDPEALDTCDLLVLMGLHWTGMSADWAGRMTYRPPSDAQKDAFTAYVRSGRPILAHHGAGSPIIGDTLREGGMESVAGRGYVRSHLSPDLLLGAFCAARRADEIERAGRPTSDLAHQHRSQVMTAVMFAVAFVEAAINELCAVCADDPRDIHVAGHPSDSRFCDIGSGATAAIGGLWQVEHFERRASILEKYQVALRLANKPLFAKGLNPYQDAALMIELRNALIHFKPKQQEMVPSSAPPAPDDLEARFAGKFSDNRIAATMFIIGTGRSHSVRYPFFPERCLGSGCALWSVRSSLQFVDDFFSRLGTTWYYHYLFDKGLMPRKF